MSAPGESGDVTTIILDTPTILQLEDLTVSSPLPPPSIAAPINLLIASPARTEHVVAQITTPVIAAVPVKPAPPQTKRRVDDTQPAVILRRKITEGSLGGHIYHAYSRIDGGMVYFASFKSIILTHFGPAQVYHMTSQLLGNHGMVAISVPMAVAGQSRRHEIVQRDLDRQFERPMIGKNITCLR